MGARSYRYATPSCIFHAATRIQQCPKVCKARSPVGISEEGIATPDVAETVGHRSTLAAVLVHGDDANGGGRGGAAGAGKVKCGGHGAVGRAIRDDEHLPTADGVLRCGVGFGLGFRFRIRGRSSCSKVAGLAVSQVPCGGAVGTLLLDAVFRFQEVDGLGEHPAQPLLLVVGWHDDGHQDLGGLDVTPDVRSVVAPPPC